jgi:hypothetical protein
LTARCTSETTPYSMHFICGILATNVIWKEQSAIS